jgi:hypothetical protein
VVTLFPPLLPPPYISLCLFPVCPSFFELLITSLTPGRLEEARAKGERMLWTGIKNKYI